MGITGLIPFLEKASKKVNIGEFSGCTVAIDSYCWLHKGAFACADKLVRGENTDIHIKYCLKYVTMLLSKNIKPVLVFDGRHLPAKAMTESKRRESRTISKKRAAELLSLGKVEEARSYMRRSVDITHAMALELIKECRKRNVDCIVAPYEADAQLAYLNMKNIAHLVITEDSDLILFGCTKVLFKMDLDGTGTLVETAKLPLVMNCPIERYTFDKFRQMCIMSGCDYLSSLPGIGLAKARQFVTATQDPNFANALKKLPSFFNKSSLTVSDEYRENFLKAEATFKHQYVYDPLRRQMVRLTEPDDEDIEQALCVNAGELLDAKIAFQLALGNLDPFTLKKMDDWHPEDRVVNGHVKTDSWKEKGISNHPSIWGGNFEQYLDDPCPWARKVKKVEPIIGVPLTRPRKKVVNMVSKYVPETQDESITIESLTSMYCTEPASKKQRTDSNNVKNDSETFTQYDTQGSHNIALCEEDIVANIQKEKSPILENKQRSYTKCLRKNGCDILKRLSKFPRTIVGENVVESKFFSSNQSTELNVSKEVVIEESPERVSKNPFKVKPVASINMDVELKIETEVLEEQLKISQKENSPQNSPRKSKSPIIELNLWNGPVRESDSSFELCTEGSVIENTYPYETLVTPVDSQSSFGSSPPPKCSWRGSQPRSALSQCNKGNKKTALKRTTSLPSNQPTLLSKFGFQKKPVLKR
ncbi:exonuclease 1 isoform X1 [Amyelois transitella]|uniref:exonuclease 1 isoform X1 n=2 Tax=Amyelois transitella TaxID=680683 RepID=UPI00298F8757|nr:exonuclease 1 isoform X1 [Amyelois transitella]